MTSSSYSCTNYGGAIYNYDGHTIGLIEADFYGNYIDSTGYSGYGGAISNNGTITIKDSSFINNYVIKGSGGALYNNSKGVMNIIADKKDVLFNGNYTASSRNEDGTLVNKQSSAIYNAGTLNLNAGQKSIIFNDKITGNGAININNTGEWDSSVDKTPPKDNDGKYTTNNIPIYAPTDGVVVLNSVLRGYTGKLSVYGGTLKLGENGELYLYNTYSSVGSSIFEDNTTLDIQNGKANSVHLSKLTLNGITRLKIDADLAGEGAVDTISTSSTVMGTGSLIIDSINILSEMDDNVFRKDFQFAGSTLKVSIDEAAKKVLTASHNYTFSLDDKNNLYVLKDYSENTFASALASDTPQRTYMLTADETLTNYMPVAENTMQGTKYVVDGSEAHYSLNGNNLSGIIIKDGQDFGIKNIGSFSLNDGQADTENAIASLNSDGTIKYYTVTNSGGWHNFGKPEPQDSTIIGGLIKTTGDVLTISNSVVSGNTFSHPGYNGDLGLINNTTGTISITGSLVKDNLLESHVTESWAKAKGGFIYNDAGDINIADSYFINNMVNGTADSGNADVRGGVIYNISGNITVTDSNFSNNSAIANTHGYISGSSSGGSAAEADGGAIFNNGGNLTVKNSTFYKNIASDNLGWVGSLTSYGGAISTNGSGTTLIEDSLFIDNSVSHDNSSAYGGAIDSNSNVTINNSKFINNSAVTLKKSGTGGAIYNSKNLDINNSEFTSNTANNGGAISNRNRNNSIIDSSFYDNLAIGSGAYGGAIYMLAVAH